SFGSEPVGSSSAPRTLTVTNRGTAPLSFSSITATNGFTVATSSTCVTFGPVAPGANCSVNVAFAPTVGAELTGTLTLTDNAIGSPHTVALAGTGTINLAVSLSPASLSFGNQPVGSTSLPKTVTLSNSGAGPLTIMSFAASKDFAQTNNCPLAPATLAAAASCTISVTFTPTAGCAETGAITISDSA